MALRKIELQRVKDAIEGLGAGQEAEEVYARLASGLQARGASCGDAAPYLPRFDGRLDDKGTGDGRPMLSLPVELAQLDNLDLAVTRQMIPSKVPILGKLADFVKAQLHELTLYYVNQLAAKQAMYNLQVNRILELLAEEVSRLEAELAHLAKQDPEEKNGQA